jgi:hypothetical protein
LLASTRVFWAYHQARTKRVELLGVQQRTVLLAEADLQPVGGAKHLEV